MKTVHTFIKKCRHWHFDEASFYGYFGVMVVMATFYTILFGNL